MIINHRQQAANEGRINVDKAKKQQGDTSIDTLYAQLPPHEKSRTTKEQFASSRADAKKRRSDAETTRYLKDLEKRNVTVGVKRRQTTTLDTHISLYMPPQVNVTYQSNYGDVEIGAGANIAAGAYQDYQKGMATSDIINKSLKSLGPEFGDELIRKALGAIDMIPGLAGAQTAIDINRGFVKTPQLELAFKGINKRTFQYAFTMIPKSEQEAEMVQAIIKSFKSHMLPAMTLGNVRRLNIPDTFNIKYYYAGKENDKLHKISECVLETMNVSYGGDRYKAFENGQPVVTNLTLNFKEMDLVTREKILGGNDIEGGH